MPESFRERVDTASAIKGILDSYPFGNGLLRELLQNSDDARSTIQVFTLDCRQHAASSLLDPALRSSQGPALLCTNDSVFRDSDWTALKTIHGSNKKADESKIGKYGLGFRSCYHVTDNPHILSSNKLVIFDPHEEFATPGGVAINLVAEGHKYKDQLAAFQPAVADPVAFSGTVIRLPLRTSDQAVKSQIRKQTFSTEDIETLFRTFIEKELQDTMLFLKNVHTIELTIIDMDGRQTSLAKVSIEDPHLIAEKRLGSTARFETFRCIIRSNIRGQQDTLTWRICHLVGQRLTDDKLFSHVGLAFPLGRSIDNGRLFSLLPLPIFTKLPAHLHAILALTPDRQALRNRQETGVSIGSREGLLVQWNLAVFETYAPRAWARLLDILVKEKEITAVWTAWPSVQQTTNEYWQQLPASVALEVVRQDLSVFPRVQPSDSPASFVSFKSSLVAPTHFPADVLQVLAKTRLVIIQPPSDMFAYDIPVEQVLNPRNIQRVLKSHTSFVDNLSLNDRSILLDYLVDSGHAVGIPLIPTVDGDFVSLSMLPCISSTYILGTADMVRLFADPDMVPEYSLSAKCRGLFCSTGCPYNVTPLTVSHLGPLLDSQTHFSAPYGAVTAPVLSWLSAFWTWIDGYESWLKVPLAQELLEALKSRALLPITAGFVCSVDSKYLIAQDLSDETRQVLQSLGLHFLNTSIPEKFLRSQGIGQDAFSLSYVLDNLSQVVKKEHRHILQAYFTAARRKPQQLSFLHRVLLKNLPIFPILISGSSPPRTSIASLSSPNVTYIKDSCCPLPVVDGTIFVNVSESETSRDMLLLVDSHALSKGLDEVAILRLAIRNLHTQTPANMDLLMSRIARRLPDLGQTAIAELGTARFVLVDDGTRRVLRDVVDPESKIAALYQGETGRFPAGAYAQDLFEPLRHYFRRSLSLDIVRERVQFIANRAPQRNGEVHGKAAQLLALLDATQSLASFYPTLSILASATWLPVDNDGLCKAQECRSALTDDEKLLFDLVLPSVLVKVESPALREALSWHLPVPFEIVFKQLEMSLVLYQDDRRAASSRLRAIINYLTAKHERAPFDSAVLAQITTVVGDKPWIPVDEQACVATRHAVLSTSRSLRLLGAFKRVRCSIFSRDLDVVTLLKSLGCADMPSLPALVNEISNLVAAGTMTKDDIISLLEQVTGSVTGSTVTSIDFQPLGSCYFNDLRRAASFSYPLRRFPCHPCLSSDLAQRLRIPFASELVLGDDDDDSDDLDDTKMGEDFTTRISGVLKDYDVAYAINEFIANALDAGATRFSICIDERAFGESSILSPEVACFQGPALLLYNNALFKKKDFEGIRKVGTGGKLDEPDTIGKFGLGALSMFHFTDLPMIVSGDQVMLLDPSGEYLPRRKGRCRTALYRSVASLTSKYSDQMAPFESLYGFSSGAPHFQGTMFRLPLRQRPSRLSAYLFTVSDVVERLKTSYFHLASSSMLFTNLESIEATHVHPSRDPSIKQLWHISRGSPSVKKVLSPCVNDTTTASHRVISIRTAAHEQPDLEDKWFICEMSLPVRDVPNEHASILGCNKALSSTAGLRFALAARLPLPSVNQEAHHLFSTLMLPVPTSLPCHINAPFALSPDRRTIRYDPPDTTGVRIPAARYNHWILSEVIPLLYQYGLGHVDAQPKDLWSLWPQAEGDEVSRSVIRGFFRSLKTTSHAICPTIHNGLAVPSNSFLVYDKHPPSGVRTVLRALEDSRLVLSPSSFIADRIKASGVKLANVDFVRSVLHNQRDALKDWLLTRSSEKNMLERVNSVLIYLLDVDCCSLAGLPLLVLKDDSIVDFPVNSRVMYYTYPHDVTHLFPMNRFLSSSYSDNVLSKLLEKHFPGIARFDGDAVISMIRERVGISPSASFSPELAEWIGGVWSALFDAKLLPDFTKRPGFHELPLLLTHQGQFISARHAKGCAVLPPPPPNHTWEGIVRVIENLGIVILADVEENRRSVETHFSLPILVSRLSSTGGSLSTLSASDHETLAQWIRPQMSNAYRDAIEDPDLLREYRKLPVWKAVRGGTSILESIDSVIVLPKDIALDALQPYLAPDSAFAEFSYDLVGIEWALQVARMTKRISDTAKFSFKRMDAANVMQYLKLQPCCHRKVPNGNLGLCLVTELYDENVPLFANCFLGRPHLFVHSSFRDQKEFLLAGGLHHDVDIATFEACATALHDDVLRHPQGVMPFFTATADLVFTFYKESLANVASGKLNSCLNKLRTLKFILRLSSRRPNTPWELTRFSMVRDFPLIVAPEDIVLRKDAPFCWSQYVLCDEENMDIVLSNSNHRKDAFAVVSIHSVVQHLRVLALQVAEHYKGDKTLLADFTATYRWLDAQTDTQTVSKVLRQYEHEALFLNVDDPETEPWLFVPATSLVFNLRFDEDDLYTVREFLSSRRRLLRLAGGSSLSSLQYSQTATSALTDSLIRSKFDQTRLQGELCDIVFVPLESGVPLPDSTHRLKAHRVFLSVMVPHFEEAFKTGMAESLSGTVTYQFPGTLFGARAFLDFVYTGDIIVPPPQTGEEMAELLEDLLELLEPADMWDIPDLKSYIGFLIDKHELLTPDTLTRIHVTAEMYRAHDLVNHCEGFKRENKDILARLKIGEEWSE
ncbi:hypothetical protein BDZ89DRAFT_1166299 [Hymenopellis radicata]|nr:hypothetical protein BDZ89DRAFT_1166299 [Hymenopellis radicata]